MIEVTPVMDGPDYNGLVEVEIDGLSDLASWSGGNEGVLFTLEALAAPRLFVKLRDALRVIEANADPP